MTSPTNWPHPDNDPELYLRHNEKRMAKEQRRPSVRKASDILGPGFAPLAVQVTDWNADELAFNGYWWSEGGTGVLNSPWEPSDWIGYTISNGETGVQVVWEMLDPAVDPLMYHYERSWRLVAGVRVYTAWRDPRHPAPYVLLNSNGTQSIPADTTTKITLGTTTHIDPGFSVASSVVTVEDAGPYDISCFADIDRTTVDYLAFTLDIGAFADWTVFIETVWEGYAPMNLLNYHLGANTTVNISFYQSQTTGTAARNTNNVPPSWLLIRKSVWP